MNRTFVISTIGSALALCLSVSAASAAPAQLGLSQTGNSQSSLVLKTRSPGHMSGSHMHGSRMGRIGPRIALGSIGHRHGHRHRHGRFFIGIPSYASSYYYDGGYDNCWWSRRFHRWLCTDY